MPALNGVENNGLIVERGVDTTLVWDGVAYAEVWYEARLGVLGGMA
jgi:hypothetical protein